MIFYAAADQVSVALIALVEGAPNNIVVRPYWYAACFLEHLYGANHHYVEGFIDMLDPDADIDDNCQELEKWCYANSLWNMVNIVYFTAGYDDINADIRAETEVVMNTAEDWFHDNNFEAKLADATRYATPWGA